jgi:copper chaperone CopZ
MSTPIARSYYVPGLSCGHCESAVSAEVGALEGLLAVTVDLSTKLVTVYGDVSDEAVVAAIDEAGFEVVAQ